MPGGSQAASAHHPDELELMEDTSGGDYLDNITPAIISRDRFKRHHQWLEEVFSSLHNMNQILPEDLGFGLTGEMSELTKDILAEPARKTLTPQERVDPHYWQDPQINTAKPYKHLTTEQYAEFERRFNAFTEKKTKEIEAMKVAHAKKIARLNKSRLYLDAEERLKEAGTDTAKLDAIAREVETALGISLLERSAVVCVQKGALEDEEREAKVVSNGNGVPAQASSTANTAGNGTDGMDIDMPNSNAQATANAGATEGGMQPESMFDGTDFGAFDGGDLGADSALLDFADGFGGQS